jgi:NAD(P) transhydrogenase subunit alpha
MLIGVIKDTLISESRIAMTPQGAARLIKKGASITVESGLGASLYFSDAAYTKVGALIDSRANILKNADILLRVRKPSIEDIHPLKAGAVHISFLDPFNETELINAMAAKNISAISLEMIPRTTLAQKMDALSSQASLAGYTAVILASERIKKIFPMMTTPAGTIPPARVFIVGAGVAGLQAIATAKRLGARVEAFDTRPVVKEQVQSLGAKFIEIDLGETGQTKDGYAKALTPEQLDKQRQGMSKICAASDVVITTAQLFGRKAPVIITKDMVAGMKPGSVLVDLAVETGGNIEGSLPGKEVDVNGVTILGTINLPGKAAVDASEMLASNFVNLIEHFWDKESGTFILKRDDDILKGCLITCEGQIVNDALKNRK